MVEPSQTGPLLLTTGAAGKLLITKVMFPWLEVPHAEVVAETL